MIWLRPEYSTFGSRPQRLTAATNAWFSIARAFSSAIQCASRAIGQLAITQISSAPRVADVRYSSGNRRS
jgi:hypothetical protein